MGHKGLNDLLLMAICCGVPLLLFLVFPVFGIALGGLGNSVVNILALLACPLGMGLMMWFMMRTQQATADQPAQVEPPARSQETRNAPAEPRARETLLSTGAPVTAPSPRPSLVQVPNELPRSKLRGIKPPNPETVVVRTALARQFGGMDHRGSCVKTTCEP